MDTEGGVREAINSAYAAWESGQAASPSADDLVLLAAQSMRADLAKLDLDTIGEELFDLMSGGMADPAPWLVARIREDGAL